MEKDKIKLIFKTFKLPFIVLFFLILISELNQLGMGEEYLYLWKNLASHILGIGILVFLGFLGDYRKITLKIVFSIYIFLNFILLICLLFQKRWLNLGFFNLQPSEFIKPLLIFLISLIVVKEASIYLSLKTLLKLMGLILVPLIFIAPLDLDYAFIMGGMFVFFVLFLGIPKRVLLILILIGALVSILMVPLGWSKLKPHQKGRILGYLYPEKYSQTWGYQLNQSLIAVGSGGIIGQGFKKGWSTKLHYLPAKRTDLAFAVWSETWGLIGVSVFLFLYGFLVYYAILVSETAKDLLGKYLSLGIALILFWQAFFNIGGVIGLLPMTSIPLPFISYGGSITVSTYILISLLFNIAFKRTFFK